MEIDKYKPNPLDKESMYERQLIDCNCSDCGHFQRDIPMTKERNKEVYGENKNGYPLAAVIHYGQCTKFNKIVGEIANHCLIHTQGCFVHRKDVKQV